MEIRDGGLRVCHRGSVYGVEAQFFTNEEFVRSRTFNPRLDLSRTPRDMAVMWAEEERKAIEGWQMDNG